MNVSVNVDRRDLFLAGFYSLPRCRANWYFMAILWTASFTFLLYQTPDLSVFIVVLLLVGSLASAMGGVLAAFLTNSALVMLALRKNSGVCGVHDFLLSPTELCEHTAVNTSHYNWSGIQSVVKVRGYILVYINSFTVYVIPQRAFISNAEFDEFFEHAAGLWRIAQAGVRAQQTGAA
jgi:hypothetical protein